METSFCFPHVPYTALHEDIILATQYMAYGKLAGIIITVSNIRDTHCYNSDINIFVHDPACELVDSKYRQSLTKQCNHVSCCLNRALVAGGTDNTMPHWLVAGGLTARALAGGHTTTGGRSLYTSLPVGNGSVRSFTEHKAIINHVSTYWIS